MQNNTTHQRTERTATTATDHAPDDPGDIAFLRAIQDPDKRNLVIAILKRAGSIPE